MSLLGLVHGCAPAPHIAPTPPSGEINPHRIDHVIVIAIDGLKRDTLLSYLRKSDVKRRGGLHELLGVTNEVAGIALTKAVAVQEAVTVFPSFTYPSWTSMFTSSRGMYQFSHAHPRFQVWLYSNFAIRRAACGPH